MLLRLRTTASCLWLYVAPRSTLTGCRYRVELFIDPWFPKVPTAPGFPLQSCRVTTASEAILRGTGCALPARPPSRSCTDFHWVTGHQDISCLAPFPCRPTCIASLGLARNVRLGRRRELHPPAPIAAVPALLEAYGYSDCSTPDWRSGICRGGAPACPFGRVCLQFGSLHYASLAKRHSADCHACESPKPSPGCLPLQTRLSCFRIAPFSRALHGTSICAASRHHITPHSFTHFAYTESSQPF